MIDSPEIPPAHGPFADMGRAGPSDRLTARMPSTPPLPVRRALQGLHALEVERVRERLATLRPLGAAAGDAPAREGDGPADRRSGLLAQLRAATTMQVCAMRGRGEPPERVLRAIKEMLGVALAMEGWLHPAAIEPLMQRVVRWSIDAYYDR